MSEEPVAYLHTTNKNKKEIYLEFGISDNKNFNSIPLYTKDQLQPKVKMTSEEFIEFKKLKSMNTTLDLIAILRIVKKFNYPNLQSRLLCSIENQTEFAELWLKCRYERLEETIEIVPNKKWFVRSKTEILVRLLVSEKEEYSHSYLTKNSVSNTIYEPLLKNELGKAIKFDTKEEAELWVNPLFEAILLPIDRSV